MGAFFVSGLKIIGHGNPDNNLESHCRWFHTFKNIFIKQLLQIPLKLHLQNFTFLFIAMVSTDNNSIDPLHWGTLLNRHFTKYGHCEPENKTCKDSLLE
jgi:hypothetical protein